MLHLGVEVTCFHDNQSLFVVCRLKKVNESEYLKKNQVFRRLKSLIYR